MKDNDLLFEIGCEELPASVIRPALNFIEQFMHKKLEEAGLSFGHMRIEGTPRRLVLMIQGLAQQQADKNYELLGPKTEIAYLATGELSKAGLGFLQSKNIDPSKAYRKAGAKGEVIAAQILEKGKLAQEILPAMLESLLSAIPFPKKMSWDDSGVQFSRPVRWLCSLLAGEILPLKFGLINASNLSCGHRFLAPEFKVQKDLNSYLAFLQDSFVELSFTERRWQIVEQARKLAQSIGGELLLDDALLDTVANLVEYPWPLLGSFDEKFLQVPMQVLVSEMREHQKVFSVLTKNGELLPAFIVVAGSKPSDAKSVAAGHARVLRARFEDGAFYYSQDCGHRLEDNVEKLNTVLFHHSLGSLKQKVIRLQKLSQILCETLRKNSAFAGNLQRAALLCKADLLSGVVGEFPELQGAMGAIYATRDQEKAVVAQAIEEHYWPKGSGGKLPQSQEGAILALADKLDTLVSIVAVQKVPSANADPFGLRRAAIGLIRIIADQGFDLPLKKLLVQSAGLIEADIKKSAETIAEEVLQFITARIRGLLIESVDDEQAVLLADAVLALKSDNVLQIWAKFNALTLLKKQNAASFEQICATFKRVGNILQKARSSEDAPGKLDQSVLLEAAEKELAAQTQNLVLNDSTQSNDLNTLSAGYYDYLQSIARLKSFVDAFFDAAMVMCEDKKLRAARIALLAQVERAVLQIADFTLL